MRQVPDRPNIELREAHGERRVVLAFPYDATIVDAVRALPNRRFDWDLREWSAPADDWVGLQVLDLRERFPELSSSAAVDRWLAGIDRRWVGYVRTTRHDGRGWWALDTLAGTVPAVLAEQGIELDGRTLVPFTAAAAEALGELRSARLSAAAVRCLTSVELGEAPPPARLLLVRGVGGERLRLEVLWDAAAGEAFERLPEASGSQLPLDPWVADELDAFVARHGVELTASAAHTLDGLLKERRAAAGARGPTGQSRSSRWRRCSAASWRRSSGPACVMCSTPAGRSWPTSRGWARRCRRWPRSRPMMRFPPWWCARRR